MALRKNQSLKDFSNVDLHPTLPSKPPSSFCSLNRESKDRQRSVKKGSAEDVQNNALEVACKRRRRSYSKCVSEFTNPSIDRYNSLTTKGKKISNTKKFPTDVVETAKFFFSFDWGAKGSAELEPGIGLAVRK